MLLKFDHNNLNLYMMTGPLETYKPSKRIKQLYNETLNLKNEIEGFALENWKTKERVELEKIFDEKPEEKEKFDKYLQEKYVPKVLEIREEVKHINEVLQKKSEKKGG